MISAASFSALRIAVCALLVVAAVDCGDDESVQALRTRDGRLEYRGEVLTDADGASLRLVFDIALSTYETGTAAGDGYVYGGYGAEGTIDVTNVSDETIEVGPNDISVVIFNSPPKHPCQGDGPSLPELCLVSHLIATRVSPRATEGRLGPGQSVAFDIRGRAADGSFMIGVDSELAEALTEAFDAGDPPAVVYITGGTLEKHWKSACDGASGPTAVITSDGTLVGPDDVEPSTRCADLVP